jgi:hypothetical protein
VFVLSADFLYDPGMRKDFLRFARLERFFSPETGRQKISYVMPAFEARDGVAISRNRSELVAFLDGRTIRPF